MRQFYSGGDVYHSSSLFFLRKTMPGPGANFCQGDEQIRDAASGLCWDKIDVIAFNLASQPRRGRSSRGRFRFGISFGRRRRHTLCLLSRNAACSARMMEKTSAAGRHSAISRRVLQSFTATGPTLSPGRGHLYLALSPIAKRAVGAKQA